MSTITKAWWMRKTRKKRKRKQGEKSKSIRLRNKRIITMRRRKN